MTQVVIRLKDELFSIYHQFSLDETAVLDEGDASWKNRFVVDFRVESGSQLGFWGNLQGAICRMDGNDLEGILG